MGSYNRGREVREAIEVGRRALEALEEASDALDSAKRWGVWDMIGGGFFSSLVKHGRLDEARDALNRARAALNEFSREAADVRELVSIDVGVTGLSTFFDVAFDNFVMDAIVQTQIDDAFDRVGEASRRVRAALERLYSLR